MAELSSGFVCLLGIGIVFIGLICIVLICNIMSFIVTKFTKADNVSPAAAVSSAPVQTSSATSTTLPAAEKRAVIAGVCAVIAEELGTDVTNIRVLSFKQI